MIDIPFIFRCLDGFILILYFIGLIVFSNYGCTTKLTDCGELPASLDSFHETVILQIPEKGGEACQSPVDIIPAGIAGVSQSMLPTPLGKYWTIEVPQFSISKLARF
jgi:hypothetical protein